MFHESPWGPNALPLWFVRPRPVEIGQGTLFPEHLPTVLAALCVSVDELARWHEQGWVSFDLDLTNRLEAWDVDEIRFVRDVVRSGLSDALIGALLAQLPRPMNFDPAAVAYSFSLGWVMARTEPEPDLSELVDRHVETWIDGLAEAEDRSRLEALHGHIEGVLESLPKAEDENQE